MTEFSFTQASSQFGDASLMPLLPILLIYQGRSISATGLLDTGATVNVLPYLVGLELGAKWEEDATSIRLTGNLAHFDAHPLIVRAAVAEYQPVNLIFAWTRDENAPLILGHVNFFAEFDVCFFRSQLMFEVQPKKA
jgi:hypothetical protein